jgi:valyl-tRNA synthetase
MPMEKTFNAAEAEQRLYDACDKAGCFKAGANAKPGAASYSVMIPPPNVNGRLHIGHAFNNTLQDILTRWHRMRGFDTLWQPGQDHAGIALQLAVENELAKSDIKRTDLTRDEFLTHAWTYKDATADGIVSQLKRPRCGHQSLRRDVQQRPDLPRQTLGELGPSFRNCDLRS